MHIALAPPSNSNHVISPSVPDSSDQPSPRATSRAENTALRASPGDNSQDANEENVETPQSLPHPSEFRRAFALVDIVFPQSPSANAGLQVNDRIIAFGAISLSSFSTPATALSALPGLLRSHENRTVDVIIYRQNDRTPITLSLTPQRWSGQGLLGCHVIPLEVSQVDEHYAPDVATMAASRTMPRT